MADAKPETPQDELEVTRDEDGETFTVTRAQWNRTYRPDGGYSLKGEGAKSTGAKKGRSKKADDAPESSED